LLSATARTARDVLCIGKIAAGYKRLPQAEAHDYGAEKLLELCEVSVAGKRNARFVALVVALILR
jgi:hypothetical protein